MTKAALLLFLFITVGAGGLIAELKNDEASVVENKIDEYDNYQQLTMMPGEVTLYVADTQKLKRLGLSNKKSLPISGAMLFEFNTDDYHGIWMKEMNFSIDIIWLDLSKRVVHIEENVAPNTYPMVFTPTDPSRYVIEFNAGYVASSGIEIGDSLDF